ARAADNLFWLGRYVERTEGVLRLLRARNVRLAESGAKHAAPLLEAIGPLFKAQGVDPDQGIPDGLLNILGGAVASAGQVRDRFSPDGWSALNDMHKTARRMATRVSLGDDAARAQSALLRKLTGFSGLVHENMYRFTGWRFLELGRFHERAMTMAALLATLADPKAPEGALDLLVEVGDSVMSHRRRFALSTTRETVIDLLGLDSMNPRALLYQLDGMRDQIALLPGAAPEGQLSDLSRAMLRTYSRLATETPETLKTKALWEIRGSIAALSDLLTESYLR
ncbi:MAG: alpha-E domain-containing protein, partial [Gemmobacter sp.]|nr:alpha-E domain-containing protein [Gemmobacter sp.]